jgi:hypothetical protein
MAFRVVLIAIISPILLLGMVVDCLLHPVQSFRRPLQQPLRMWLSVSDWVRGVPVGYTYWERYEARAMLDEIEVHHEDAS